MPIAIPTSNPFDVKVYRSASEISSAVWSAWNARERDANVQLPHALSTLEKEQKGQRTPPGQLWISVSSTSTPHSARFQSPATPTSTRPSVDFVLSCTEWDLGTYPIFIFSAHSPSELTSAFCEPRLHELVETLVRYIPVDRVYSVFAPSFVSKLFARAWLRKTGVETVPQPYYAASSSYCTPRTFRNRSNTIVSGMSYNLRRAQEEDIPKAAALCKGFASTSEPFTHTDETALHEAKALCRKGQLWVHTVETAAGEDIASIVATTRVSKSVTAITKVYTNPAWRKRGCAERLVRKVCRETFLRGGEKHSIVLFVAHDNPGAAKVYDRVGFQGLMGNPKPADSVDDWLEIGFEGATVGHW